jgi:hypothetical protein
MREEYYAYKANHKNNTRVNIVLYSILRPFGKYFAGKLMRLSFDNLYAVISPEFFSVSVHIKGSNRFKKADYFGHLQLTASGFEISLPLLVWSDDPNK